MKKEVIFQNEKLILKNGTHDLGLYKKCYFLSYSHM